MFHIALIVFWLQTEMHTCTHSHHPFLSFLWGFSTPLFYPLELLLPTASALCSLLPSTVTSYMSWEKRVWLPLWWYTAIQCDVQHQPSGFPKVVISDLNDKDFVTCCPIPQKALFPRSNELSPFLKPAATLKIRLTKKDLRCLAV